MSELADLMTVFGAVDEAVVGDPTLAPSVAALVPEYETGAVGWFDGIRTWAAQATEAGRWAGEERDADPRVLPDLPRLPEAIGRLAAGAEFTEGLAGRRLLAIALLSRVQPSPTTTPTGPVPTSVSTDTLTEVLRPVVALASDRGVSSLEARTSVLLDILSSAPSRSAMIQAALAGGLVSEAVADQVLAPSTWTVVPSTESGGPAVAFETRLRVEATPITTVEAILNPANWTGFSPPWCKMTALGAPGVLGSTRCLEVIALDCVDADPPLFVLQTVLDFQSRNLVDGSGSVLEYRLCDDQPGNGGDGLVTVDEGSLVVRTVGPAVEVVTTKRVQFRAFSRMMPLEAAGLAWFVWILGYNSLAGYFIEHVAGVDPSRIHVVGTHRRGTGPAADAPPGSGGSGPPGPHRHSGHHDRWYSQIDRTADALEGAWSECWRDARASVAAMAAGRYGPADYLSDTVKLSSHLARHGTLMVKFWAGVAPGSVPGSDPAPEFDPVP